MNGVINRFQAYVFRYLRIRTVEQFEGIEHLRAGITLPVDDDVGQRSVQSQPTGCARVGNTGKFGQCLNVLGDVHFNGFYLELMSLAV